MTSARRRFLNARARCETAALCSAVSSAVVLPNGGYKKIGSYPKPCVPLRRRGDDAVNPGFGLEQDGIAPGHRERRDEARGVGAAGQRRQAAVNLRESVGVWIGDWSVVEELRDAPAGAPFEFVGTAQCRWLPGGYQIEWRQKGVLSNDRYERLASKRGFLDIAPDLVVEVLSPRDSAAGLTQKLREYFAAGVRLVWVADPEAKAVLAYRSLTDVRELRESDRLPGDDVLPSFDFEVARLFEE